MAHLFNATALSCAELAPGITKELTCEAGADKTLPAVGQTVYVHYTGKLKDGSVFDSSVKRGQPFSFRVGIGQVINAWDVAVLTMAVGEKCVVTASSDNAYGDAGSPPVIPPKATLYFEIECLSIGKAPAGMEEGGFCAVM